MILHARGTIGMGDAMMYLNVAHAQAYLRSEQVTLYIHWPHDKDFYHHFEDDETIVERTNYIHNFYKDKDSVNLVHIFNHENSFLEEYRLVTEKQYVAEDIKGSSFNFDARCSRLWLLDESRLQPTVEKKIVLWRPKFNSFEPRPWKLPLDDNEWQKTIDHFQELGYNVVELTYRTPIREALYHCSTCEYAVFYDGMWHMATTMMFKPSLVIGNSSIAMYNSVNAVPVRTAGEMRRMRGRWTNILEYWSVPKNDGEGGLEILPRFNGYNITTPEYMKLINQRMKGRFMRAINRRVDWTQKPVLIMEEDRKKYLDI